MTDELARFHQPEKYYSYDSILFIRTISVSYYITEEHVVFILHVPLIDPITYNLYHLYSIPTAELTTIIPPTSYVAMSDEHTYYLNSKCQEIQEEFFCRLEVIERSYQQDTCIQNLLKIREDPRCLHVPVNITDTLVETINDEKYLLILPTETAIHEKCGNEEVHKLRGTFLITVPYSCEFIARDFEYINLQGTVKEEPVYLPYINRNISNVKPIQLNLKSFNLDQLSKLTLQQEDTIIPYNTNNELWTRSSVPLYTILTAVLAAIFIYKNRRTIVLKYQDILRRHHQRNPEEQLQHLQAFPTPP